MVEDVRGSFRDPSGFVYLADGVHYRQVNQVFAESSTRVFLRALRGADGRRPAGAAPRRRRRAGSRRADAYEVIEPERIPFISYPYEWSFGQLKDAALSTLDVQERALDRGILLRDASAYNVQFRDGRPLLIDTLSFEPLARGDRGAYKQFCEHFLVPLALMSMRDVRCGRLQRALSGRCSARPWQPRCSPGATGPRAALCCTCTCTRGRQAVPGGHPSPPRRGAGAQQARSGVWPAFATAVSGSWRPAGTAWADYSGDHNYSEAARAAKRRWCATTSPRPATTVWDLGGNTGRFSRIGAGDRPVGCLLRRRPGRSRAELPRGPQARGDRDSSRSSST